MMIEELGLDPRITKKLQEQGITELYPPQEEAMAPALRGDNLVLAMPTASGKSLVAYLAILQAILKGGKALYIVPLKALASEKYDDLSKFSDLGITVAESTGDYDEVDPKLQRYDIVIATSEKADSLLRHRTKWIDQLSVVVADEVHLLNDPERGPTLEVILAKFRTFNSKAQLIALSATIKNADELSDWLDAKLVTSDWRPVPLREGVYVDGEIFFTDNSKRNLEKDESPVKEIVKDAIKGGGQCLVFVNTRRSCESLALELGKLTKVLRPRVADGLLQISRRMVGEQEEPTTMGTRLGRCIRNGCSFHHAGLTSSQRRVVESAFREGLLGCIVATPTLAAGINLPARTVVVRDLRRFDANVGYASLPVLEVRQMCGRAGRPRFDPYGEAILIARDEEERYLLMDNYLLGESESIFSKLGTEPAMRSHLLALIATSDVRTLEELESFFGRTFLSHQMDTPYLSETIELILEFLKEEGMVADEDGILRATQFGKRVSDLYIDPKSAIIMRDALEKYKGGPTFGLLHAICSVPDMPLLYLRKSDYEWTEELLNEVQDQLIFDPPTDLSLYEGFLSELKTAKLILDWSSEVHENEIADKFGIGPGDIRNKVEMAEWLAHSMRRLSELFNKDARRQCEEIVVRIKYGILPELLDLVHLRGLGRVRARALHARGIESIEDIRNTSYDRLKQIPTIGEAVARAIKDQLGQTDPTMPALVEDGQRSLVDFR
ncbi:MAG: DEAD/DEAH box helicase [Thermoplasmata archaeon]|nr:DEAD/DEAH box helicase [Thermoplasmata archaeon]TFG68536.1 MAG: DEAD/DEAH box helicase [Methanomassiliicoccus sp.]